MTDHNEQSARMVELTRDELQNVYGGSVCHGVSVLAYARVDGVSPSRDDVMVDGRIITAEKL